MARKGIDKTFLHYGVRTEDMHVIEELCKERDFDIDPVWLQEQILKPFQAERNKNGLMDEKNLAKLLKRALKNI